MPQGKINISPYALRTRAIPTLIRKALDLPVYYPGIIMEGEVRWTSNGKGTLITSSCCSLNSNRNPHLGPDQIEGFLMDYYGVEQVYGW